MQFSRPRCLRASIVPRLAALIGLLAAPLFSQQQPAPQQPKPPNPFEQVPPAQESAPAKPLPPKPEAAKPAAPGAPPPSSTADRPPSDTIESINRRGARYTLQHTTPPMRFMTSADVYDGAALVRL